MSAVKRCAAILLAVILAVSLAVPARAVTLGKWDLDAGYRHAMRAGIQQIETDRTVRIPMHWLEAWIWQWMKK